MQKFVHLHTHSHYSLLDGLSKIDQLVDKAKKLGMDALAVTDHGNLYGSVEFYKKATSLGIKPIIGVEIYVARGSRHSKDPKLDTERYHLTLIVKNSVGYQNLIQLVTKAHLEGFYYKPRIDRELLEKYHDGIICLSGCPASELNRAIEHKNMDTAFEIARYYKNLFGEDYYIEIQPQTKYPHKGLTEIAEKLNVQLVATQDSHYIDKDDKPIHEILLAIQTGNKIDDEDRFTFGGYVASLCSYEEMIDFFKDGEPEIDIKLFKKAVENTVSVADKCDFQFELGKTILPEYPLPEGDNSNTYLEKLVNEGVTKRFGKKTEKIEERLKHELSVIAKTGFADYFLIVQDFVNWAKNHGIAVGPGRGSAAGSLVSYSLNITDVDPLKYDLLFERFLNPERNEMPDIDIDFADHRRDEVLGYLRQKYGENHVAQIITFGTMAARAAVRDAGRAIGLPYSFCDRIAKLIPFVPNQGIEKLKEYVEKTQELKQLYEGDKQVKELIDVASKLEGVARHASVHACGVVVSKEPVVKYLPLQRAPQDENTIITQIEMHGVEDLGLLKIDLLGLRNLTIIEETVRLIKDLEEKSIDISNIPLDDKETYKLLQSAETAGVFQFESSGMRRYMKDIKPTELEDLVALVSLYRPGPMELIPSYIKRKTGLEDVTYLHPKLEPIMQNTYGIGVYQEQMMRIATDLAGYTLPEADTLRKAIGKKIKSLLEKQKEKLIDGLINNGIDKRTAEKIWGLFPPFARYGFNRSHAVSYALIGYRTAYLKTHYPVEFITALLNNASSDIERVTFFINEAQRLKIEVLPPDVNRSTVRFMPEEGNIRFGLATIKNVGERISEAIVNERLRNGPYESITGFARRNREYGLNKKGLESLIKSGALDSLGVERMTALENMDIVLRAAGDHKASSQTNLFGDNHKFEVKLKPAEKPAAKNEKLAWEKELIGLYVTEHPLKEYIEKNGNNHSIKSIDNVFEEQENILVRICGVISKVQRIRTRNGSPMLFVKVEDLSNNIEILVFSDTLSKNPSVWQENNSVLVSGRISKKDGDTKLICLEAKQINH
jgi:DNA polymerase-3 subunit alpha